MLLGFQLGQQLELVAQSQRGMIWLRCQEFVIKAPAVADPVALRIEGQTGISTRAVLSSATGSSAMGSGIPA